MDKCVIFEIVTTMRIKAGGENFVYLLSKELQTRPNVDLHLVILGEGLDSAFNDFKDLNKTQIHFIPKHKSLDFKAAKALRKLVKKFKPSIIHSNLRCVVTYFLAFGPFKHKFRYFHTLHNVPKGEGSFVDRFFKRWLLINHAIFFVSISKILEDEYKHFYHTKRVVCIENGVELSTNPFNKNKIYDFICLAQFRPQKNHMLLLRCFDVVNKKFPKSKLLLLGDGETCADCVKFSKTLNCANNIEFKGKVDNPFEYLEQSRIMVLSSSYEGTPLSVAEAMSCGLGLILPLVGGIPDMVTDQNALLYETNNEESLIKAMEYLMNNPEIVIQQGNANVVDARRFNVKTCADNYLQLFNNR